MGIIDGGEIKRQTREGETKSKYRDGDTETDRQTGHYIIILMR